jgi:hypothetical protein
MIDLQDLKLMVMDRPDTFTLKNSGVLKLINEIERLRELAHQARAERDALEAQPVSATTCSKCGVDRLQSPCQDLQNCGYVGTAYVAQPVSAGLTDEQRAALINAMCMTWRHDFGLNKPEANGKAWPFGIASGMNDQERQALRTQMTQLVEHHFLPLLSAAQRDSQPVASADARDAAILRAGAVLSNIAFNMAQRRLGEPLTGDDARALYNARNQWDAAIAASKQTGGA